MALRFVLLDIGINDAGHILVFFFIDFCEEVLIIVIGLNLVAEIEIVFFRFFLDDAHAGVLEVLYGFFNLFFFELVLFLAGRRTALFDFRGGLSLGLLNLGLLFLFRDLFFLVLLFSFSLSGLRLRLTRPALLVEGLRLEGECTFWAFDRPFLKVVETGATRGACTLRSEICLDQG